MNKKILITGANGLIGHELLKQLSEENTIYALSRSKPDIIHSNIFFIEFDLTQDFNAASLPAEIDIIYHLAQSEHFREFPKKSMDVFHVNTLSTLRLLDYARKRGCKQFIYASSGGVYGNSNEGFTEDQPLLNKENLGFYLSTKFCSELLAENYSSYFDVIITRFFFVYGERQNKSMLIPRLIDNIKNGLVIGIQGKEGLKINPIYVDDVAVALMKMMTINGSYKINIGGEEILSLKEICNTIGEILNTTPHYKINGSEAKHIIGDITKMKSLLTPPKTTLKEGISRLIESAS